MEYDWIVVAGFICVLENLSFALSAGSIGHILMGSHIVQPVHYIKLLRIICILIIRQIVARIIAGAAGQGFFYGIPWSAIAGSAGARALGPPQAALSRIHAVSRISSDIKMIVVTLIPGIIS